MSVEEKIPEDSQILELASKNDEIEIETKTSFWNVFKWSMYD